MRSYEFSDDPRGFVSVNTLVITAEEIRAMWRDVAAHCDRSGIRSIVGRRGDNERRSLPDLKTHVEIFREFGIDHRYRIAWIEANPSERAVLTFTCDLLRTSHVIYDIQAFPDEESAVSWITSFEDARESG